MLWRLCSILFSSVRRPDGLVCPQACICFMLMNFGLSAYIIGACSRAPPEPYTFFRPGGHRAGLRRNSFIADDRQVT